MLWQIKLPKDYPPIVYVGLKAMQHECRLNKCWDKENAENDFRGGEQICE